METGDIMLQYTIYYLSLLSQAPTWKCQEKVKTKSDMRITVQSRAVPARPRPAPALSVRLLTFGFQAAVEVKGGVADPLAPTGATRGLARH